MQWVGPDGQADARMCRHARDPATDRGQHDPRRDRAVRRLHPDHPLALAQQAGHRRVLDDMDAPLRCTRRVGPGHPVVTSGRPLDVVRSAHDRVAATSRQVHLGDQLLELGGRDHEGLRPTAVFIRHRARSARIAISVWASQKMPLVWWGTPAQHHDSFRANYGSRRAIRFYQHSLEMYQHWIAETGAAILHQTKGIFWLAHTEMAMRAERARCLMNTACGAKDLHGHARRAQGAGPQVDLTGGGR